MPRRVYTYAPEMGWGALNLLSTLGASLLFVSFALFFGNMMWSRRRGAIAGPNPWDSPTLEWATASPPPPFNFARLPVVTGREPLWEEREGPSAVVAGLSTRVREYLVTTTAEAVPSIREVAPHPSIWPFLSAVATTALFIGSIFTPWAVVWGSIPLGVCLIAWFWPKGAVGK
jgi:heme/copper-type cytochrome/quinol oxidase subunit 1